jgi:hypothetical protein
MSQAQHAPCQQRDGQTALGPSATTHLHSRFSSLWFHASTLFDPNPQRVIFLKTSGVTPDSITVELPSLKSRVANPGYYMLWILEGDVPAKEARWIKLG